MSLATDGPGRRAADGYPAQVTSEPNPATEDPAVRSADRRPRRLTYAAALAALEGVALVVGGAWMLVGGLTGEPDDRRSAVTGGITLLALALLPLLAARGLLGLRGWSRGPAVITQIMALPVAYTLLQADSVAIPAGIVLGIVAVVALALLLHPETNRALGIRGPGAVSDDAKRGEEQRGAGK